MTSDPHHAEAGRRRPRRSVALLFLTLSAFAVSMTAVPPLATTIARDLGGRFETFGYVFMLQFLCFTLVSLWAGWAAEHGMVNSCRFVECGLFVLGAALLSGACLPRIGLFLVWAVPLGLAGGLVEPFGAVMITDLERPGSSKLMNLSQVFFCLGAVFTPQLVAILLANGLSWRTAFVIFGICILVIAALFTLLSPCRNGPPDNGERVPSHAEAEPRRRNPFTQRLFYLLATFLLLYVVIESGTACWIAAYFEKRLLVTPAGAAWRLAVFWTGLIVGRMTMLALPVRWTLWRAAFAGACGMTLANGILSLPLTAGPTTAALFLAGIASGPVWPVTVSICKVVRDSARFTASVIAVGAIGCALGPFLSSLVIRYIGMVSLFPVLTAGGIPLIVVLLAARREERRSA